MNTKPATTVTTRNECDCAADSCSNTFTITGDGSHAFRTDPERGGIYFCSEVCARNWETMQKK